MLFRQLLCYDIMLTVRGFFVVGPFAVKNNVVSVMLGFFLTVPQRKILEPMLTTYRIVLLQFNNPKNKTDDLRRKSDHQVQDNKPVLSPMTNHVGGDESCMDDDDDEDIEFDDQSYLGEITDTGMISGNEEDYDNVIPSEVASFTEEPSEMTGCSTPSQDISSGTSTGFDVTGNLNLFNCR